MNLQELYDKRAKAWKAARDFLDAHAAEGTLSAEDAQSYDRMEQEIKDLTTQINRQQRLDAMAAEMAAPTSTPITGRPVTPPAEERGRASRAYAEDFGALLRGHPLIHNVLEEGVGANGGYLVSEEMERQIAAGLLENNVVRQLAHVITTAQPHRIPVAATHSAASWYAENAAIQESAPTFAQKVLDAHKLGDLIKVSIELLQDAQFDVEGYVTNEIVQAFSSKEEEGYCVGTGAANNQPEGIFTASGGTVGKTTAAPAKIEGDEIIDLVYALKAPYRRKAAFLMKDATVATIRKLKDNNGVYMWQPALQLGEPDKLLGYPLYTSPYVPAVAAGALVAAFGDFSNYWIADRAGRTIQRLGELYAVNGQVGYVATQRVDGKVVIAEGIQLLKMHA